jgi:hypothetical protein
LNHVFEVFADHCTSLGYGDVPGRPQQFGGGVMLTAACEDNEGTSNEFESRAMQLSKEIMEDTRYQGPLIRTPTMITEVFFMRSHLKSRIPSSNTFSLSSTIGFYFLL